MLVARDLKIDLATGYLFRPTNPQRGIVDSPFSSATTKACLKSYLKNMRADDGEMLHGFRSGCAITLALTGADLSEIMDHVEWTRRHTALYYLQLAKVLNPSGASGWLAATDSTEVINPWQDVNQLTGFISAFPVNHSDKLNLST